MESTNIIRNIIRKELNKIYLMEWESGHYPLGAENDSDAPWNQGPEPEIEFEADYDTHKFSITVDNGNSYEVDFIDVLDKYWKKHENEQMYQKHAAMFPEDENMEVNIIQMLLADESANAEIEEILYNFGGDNLRDD